MTFIIIIIVVLVLGENMFNRTKIFEGMVSCTDFPERVHRFEKRNEKVMTIRKKLRSGKYNENKRMNVILDKILEDILT